MCLFLFSPSRSWRIFHQSWGLEKASYFFRAFSGKRVVTCSQQQYIGLERIRISPIIYWLPSLRFSWPLKKDHPWILRPFSTCKSFMLIQITFSLGNATCLIPEADSGSNTRRIDKHGTLKTPRPNIGPNENFLSHLGTSCVSSYVAYAISTWLGVLTWSRTWISTTRDGPLYQWLHGLTDYSKEDALASPRSTKWSIA